MATMCLNFLRGACTDGAFIRRIVEVGRRGDLSPRETDPSDKKGLILTSQSEISGFSKRDARLSSSGHGALLIDQNDLGTGR